MSAIKNTLCFPISSALGQKLPQIRGKIMSPSILCNTETYIIIAAKACKHSSDTEGIITYK
jgi:hypothetical protein